MSGVAFSDLPTLRGDQQPVAALDERSQELLKSIERKARARDISVPTDDSRVKAQLSELGHPIIIFGEGAAERRDRLRFLLVDLGRELTEEQSENENIEENEEEFYTPGSDKLLQQRRWLARFSLNRTKERLEVEKNLAAVPLSKIAAHRREFNQQFASFTAIGSQIVTDRPVCISLFSPDSSCLLVGSWGGQLKMYSVPDLTETNTITAHTDRIGGICWRPNYRMENSVDGSQNDLVMTDIQTQNNINSNIENDCLNEPVINNDPKNQLKSSPSTGSLENSKLCAHPEQSTGDMFDFASSGGDGLVRLWHVGRPTALSELRGHIGRVSRIDIHPSGRYLGSAGFDMTWRLWDLETQKELLLQEGHSREVYAIRFQDDGALCATGGLDAIGRVWDLRSGRTIMVLDGHIRDITSIDFRGGFQIATGSADDSIKIWDLRMVACKYTIPAHKSLVSGVRFLHGELLSGGMPRRGNVFVSSGYDGHVKIWSADDWQLLKSLAGHDDKIMSCDISSDAKWIASSGFDRTVKLWAQESVLF